MNIKLREILSYNKKKLKLREYQIMYYCTIGVIKEI